VPGPILIVILAICLIAFYATLIFLYLMVWTLWRPKGRRVLYVYSERTTWKEHVEANLLPKFVDRVVVINWSERKRWKITLATLIFRHFAGSYDFASQKGTSGAINHFKRAF
jgi:hypothetical protein